ncbi:MAG: hypothetical protein NWQ46_08505 [Spirosomaceae bacterium]|nr:hypothetical protein [Spirosomataceae bacterium]
MKTIKILLPIVVLFFAGCKEEDAFKTNASDYNVYLDFPENKNYDLAKEELSFWTTKYEAAPNQLTYLSKMAAAHGSLFETTGDVNHLYKTEAYLKDVNGRFNYENAASIRALARNYISQHRFRESLELLEKAEQLGDGKTATDKMLFYVHMELGNYDAAEK